MLLPPAYIVRWEGNSFTLFVCPHQGGSGPAGGGGGGQVQPGGGGVRSVSRWRGGGGGVRSSQPEGVRSSQPGGGGGPGPAGGGGQVQRGGGGVSILRPLAGGMPLPFTQEVFLVYY